MVFRTCPDRAWSPPSFLYNGYRVSPGVKERPGRDADPSPPSSAVGHERVELYLYSPYGPYGLYRASVPVQGCTLPYSRAIPLLPLWAVRPVQSLSRTIPLFPLWAVRPVQSLSACTRVHFTFTHRVEIWVSRRTSLEDLERTESLSSAENRTAIRRSSTP